MSDLPKCKTCNGAKVTRHKGKDWSPHPYGCATCDGTGLDLPTIRAALAFKERTDKAERWHIDGYDNGIPTPKGKLCVHVILVSDLYPKSE